MVVRRELLRGVGRLNATTTVLQRARLADPLGGMWEAADVQWWWRRPRATDELALPVWFDEAGPVAELKSRGVVFEEYDFPGLKTPVLRTPAR